MNADGMTALRLIMLRQSSHGKINMTTSLVGGHVLMNVARKYQTMSSKHHITTIYDPDGAETEVRVHFVLHAYVPMRGPSYASGGEPEEPATVEFDRVQMFVLGQWVDAPKLAEWAEAYLQNDGFDDAMTTAHDDQVAGEECAAEMRAEWRKET